MISVVIPLYNKEKQIKKTLKSVFDQTFQDYEIIIVNDGSTDRSMEIVEAFSDPKIRIIEQENQGVSAARNTGIKNARYDYIAFLDADDEWDPLYLTTQFDLVCSYKECSVFACAYLIKQQRYATPISLNKLPFKDDSGVLTNYFEVASSSYPPIWTSAVMVEKKAIEAVGGFPVGITSGEDLLTWARLAFHYKIAYNISPLATFLVDESHQVDLKPARLHDQGDYVGDELVILYNSATDKLKRDLKKYVSLWYKMRASVFLRLNDKKNTIKYSRHSLRYNPFNYKVYLFMIIVLLPSQLQKIIKKQYRK